MRIKQLGWQREQKAHNLETQLKHLEEQLDEVRARALELELDLDWGACRCRAWSGRRRSA